MEWFEFLLGFDLAAITVHGRTVKEMSKVPAHWDLIGEMVKLRDQLGKKTLIIGNGDVVNLADARKKAKESGVDGVMIGRGIFENFWIFDDSRPEPTVQERLNLLLEHTNLFDQTWQGKKNFNILKKFYKIYVSGFDGAKELRTKLMETKSATEVKPLIENFNKAL
jgi:tRNA-dihydrouridine synthase